MTIYPFIFIRKNTVLTETDLNHERIHLQQQIELLLIGFYLWYVAEWMYRIITCGYRKAYRNISFEREAYTYENIIGYRKPFGFLSYL